MTIFVITRAPDGWPACPLCGHPAALRISVQQAFCGNEECRALMWDPTSPDPRANPRDVLLFDQVETSPHDEDRDV